MTQPILFAGLEMSQQAEAKPVTDGLSPWYKLVPGWFKVAAPALAALVAISGFFLGQGEGRGRTEEMVNGHERRISVLEKHREDDRAALNDLTGKLVSQVAEIRGELTAIRAYFKIPAPGAIIPVPAAVPVDGAP